MTSYSSSALLLSATLLLGCDTTESAPALATAQGSATASVASAKAAPKVVAVEQDFAFGKVKLGSTVKHTFKLRNEGSAPLLIERAKGS